MPDQDSTKTQRAADRTADAARTATDAGAEAAGRVPRSCRTR